ncbi:MAG: class I mannose-6-phosphate isomerase [Bryobacteraceae bacterium]|nr:class I mannose-6-phosphate isomerase [Bryobacteraceae bacterium]
MSGLPVRLEPFFVEKVWGSASLAPWFPDSGRRIGEVWFPAEDILVKFIYTTEKLSVQVHPPGKTEMWHVLRAEPGAAIALGFRRPVTKEEARRAALSGEIEELLEWYPVSAGDSFLNPAGTVHALGAGMGICEIQQNYPVTYRLYDYGRPRELHVEEALEVLRCERHPGKTEPAPLAGGGQRLITCDYFVADAITPSEPLEYRPAADRYHLLIAVEGAGTIAGEPFSAGELWRVPADGERFAIRPDGGMKILRTFNPA